MIGEFPVAQAIPKTNVKGFTVNVMGIPKEEMKGEENRAGSFLKLLKDNKP